MGLRFEVVSEVVFCDGRVEGDVVVVFLLGAEQVGEVLLVLCPGRFLVRKQF